MGNINDYLLWRGDIPLNQRFKFNEIDSMILSRFSYLRFDKIKMEKEETISSISDKMKDIDDEEFLYHGDKELITNLGQSNRFKDMIVTDYVKIDDKSIEKQFGAVTVHISEKEMYISYLGTDATITGWKEDFNMAFMDNVPCQVSGREYFQNMCAKYPNKKVRIGGHSKGGNVALYAAITAPKQMQDRIIKVDNYDGPGLSKEIFNEYDNRKILNKMETYIPQDSIIGRILYHREKVTVSSSIEKLILQHDIYSWQVLGNTMIRSAKPTELSEDFNKTVSEWLETTTSTQRKIFFDSVFEVINTTKADTFGDIGKSMSKNIPKILNGYQELSVRDRKTITENIKVFTAAYFNIVKERESSKLNLKKEEISEKYLNKIKEVKNKLKIKE
ncbi:MAG: DUF2974 domain-containing protein [Clostridia bacterium]|nr:DUF2974 domain-containing protein [Clostridia bacterium]